MNIHADPRLGELLKVRRDVYRQGCTFEGYRIQILSASSYTANVDTLRSYCEKFEKEFVELTGVKVIIGKGGMGPNTEYACKNYKAIHCVFPAGNAVVAATEVEEIVRAEWRDLGMPETLWNCRVKEFGPLIVSIDTEGRNLFEENKVIFNERKEKAYEEICKHVSFIK